MPERQSSVVRTPVRELKRPPSAWSGESDEESSDRYPLLIPTPQKSNPTERMRRIDTMLEFAVTGFLGIGSALLIAFYVTGPPRFDDMASSTTVVLLLTMVSGCCCCLPSW
ncbi:hypothetical protein RHOSPDRAFT_31494 [Rhodotorula sp. JG-1b]|nr:hypothetical protein RHOSPDRAFT_31494 [Rhodotorula sp. JG-1b]